MCLDFIHMADLKFPLTLLDIHWFNVEHSVRLASTWPACSLMIRPCTEHHSLLWFISSPCKLMTPGHHTHTHEECNWQCDISGSSTQKPHVQSCEHVNATPKPKLEAINKLSTLFTWLPVREKHQIDASFIMYSFLQAGCGHNMTLS